MNIMCYYILNYDDNLIIIMIYVKMSFIIVYLTHLESVISWYFLSQYLKQLNNFIKFNFQYRYTPTLEVKQCPLHKSREHPTAIQYHGSADLGVIDLKSDVN